MTRLLSSLIICSLVAAGGGEAFAEKGRRNGGGNRPTPGVRHKLGPAKAGAQRNAQAQGRRQQQSKLNLPKASQQRAQQRGSQQIRTSAAARPPIAPVRKGGLWNFIVRNLTVRSEVRAVTQQAKDLARSGHLIEAAASIPQAGKDPLPDLGWRERRALARATKVVLNESISQARATSRAGDTQSAKSAVVSLRMLDRTGRVGWFGRWRAGRAENKVVNNAARVAKKTGRWGNYNNGISIARDNVRLIAELRGRGDPKALAAMHRFGKNAMKTAYKYARSGEPQMAHQSLSMAAEAAGEGGAPFDEYQADQLMEKAYKNAVPKYIYDAQRAYNSKQFDQAASLLVEAREIQESLGIRPSWLARRYQNKLEPRLANRMDTVRQALAEQRAAEEAARQAPQKQPRGAARGRVGRQGNVGPSPLDADKQDLGMDFPETGFPGPLPGAGGF